MLLDQRQLQKEVSNKKQEAQALMAEMESIAQAFEEMQEQNIRLLQQLKVSNKNYGRKGLLLCQINMNEKVYYWVKQLVLGTCQNLLIY